MLQKLTKKQQNWVDSVFSSMTMEEKAAQLLHPEDRGYSFQDWEDLISKVPVGSVFIGQDEPAKVESVLRYLQAHSKIPLAVSADMENGVAMFKNKGTIFPMPMALGACANPEYAYQMGRITARESRARGVHWTFSPVTDLNLNPDNPITNVRSLGDDPDKVIPLLRELVRGLQENSLMAAACKHFPGDGVDDRDQHMLVSCNLLPFDQWKQYHGRVWKEMIEAGTMSIMAGHISLPDYQGCADDPDRALPATLSSKLQIDLLRKELGFEGVLVTDAYPMIGFTCRFPEEELAWRSIQAGADSLLFANPVTSFQSIMTGLRTGKLSEERVNESVYRLLCMKARLNLFEGTFGEVVSDSELAENQKTAQKVADDSVTVLREKPGLLPLDPKKVKKVLTVSFVRNDDRVGYQELETVDRELRARGLEVDHIRNPGDKELFEALEKYDILFLNFESRSHAGIQLRITGKPILGFWHSFFTHAPEKLVYTSFGTPYTLYEMPYLSNLLCVWGREETSQKAAVKAWFGEIPAKGVSPVRPQKAKVARYV